MSVSLSTAVGRCDGSGGALSVRHHLFKGATSNGLELLDRLENTALGRGVSVEDWLDDHPAIREAIQWEHTGFLWLFPASTSYAFWPAEDKETLQELVDAYAACELQTFADPPTNQLDLEDEDAVGVELSASTAKRRFMAHVAHSLAVEMGEWVPWSLTDYDENELAFLLDSRNLFTWKIFGNYEIEFDKHAPAVSARPRFTYEFLFENDLIGYDRLDTIARVINWCRWNMRHFSAHRNDDDEPVGGDYSVLSMDLHWQYRGFPPVRRIIEGTTRDVTEVLANWTGGCHGTVGFLRAVLRTINIPVKYLRRCNHALPHFMHVNRYMSHGDDPYNQCAKREDLPAEALLLDAVTFNTFFGPSADSCANIGRGVKEATADLTALPDLPSSCFE